MNIKNKIVELNRISLKYHTPKKEILVLDNLNLDIYEREFVTIVGPSGCGKSTTLSLISGLITPSLGKIFINGKSLNSINSKTAYMLQRDYLFNWRTIEENVMLGLEIRKILLKSNKKYALRLLKKYGLKKFLECYPYQISGGMRQKAALIRTLAVKPEILLLDEPFSALDYQTRITISEEVKQIINEENKTAVLVSHDISEAIFLSDRVVVFSNRPSKVQRILKIEFDENTLTVREKRNHKKFNEYFEIIWNELNKK
ncbi:MAG: ABC transporter ATP-binding protein [Oscillospiraceae bacterium]|jgi:NitT/TauT family transport system ATP-binding protein|nr:ABC transporter ATP-binding protein [Oscillospiraceae bacterium]